MNIKKKYIFISIIIVLFILFVFNNYTNNNSNRKKNINNNNNFILKNNKNNTLNHILKNEKALNETNILLRKCEFIDIVYTWVNGTDPNHIKDRIKYQNYENTDYNESIDYKNLFNDDEDDEDKSGGDKIKIEQEKKELLEKEIQRFRDYGSLKYSLRSVRKYAPWVKNIYIVTANQIPTWFNTSNSENIKFIFHKEFFKKKSDLPTFNSNSIESNFYNLPEQVSNCFLYLNDDLFFRENVQPSDFFDSEFNQNLFESKEMISSFTPIFDSKLSLQLDLWTKSLVMSNRELDLVWNEKKQRINAQHGVQVFNRKVWILLKNELSKPLERTSSNRFRSFNDIQIPFTYNQFAKRYSKYHLYQTNNKYYALEKINYKQVLENVLKNEDRYKTICLNDLLGDFNDNGYNEIVKEINQFFEKLFSKKEPFENDY